MFVTNSRQKKLFKKIRHGSRYDKIELNKQGVRNEICSEDRKYHLPSLLEDQIETMTRDRTEEVQESVTTNTRRLYRHYRVIRMKTTGCL